MSQPVSDALAYVQFQLGAAVDASGLAIADTSWSARLQGSENLWMLLEGTHVLTIMLFVGSILFVDLRLLGVAWRKVPVSAVADSVLPYTVAGFTVMVLTGAALFFANPLEYYHGFVFRIKAVVLIVAAINIFIFHRWVQADRDRWDAQAKPPLPARLSAAASLTLWVLVVVTGRYAAYDWFACDQVTGFVAAFSQCADYTAALAKAEGGLAL